MHLHNSVSLRRRRSHSNIYTGRSSLEVPSCCVEAGRWHRGRHYVETTTPLTAKVRRLRVPENTVCRRDNIALLRLGVGSSSRDVQRKENPSSGSSRILTACDHAATATETGRGRLFGWERRSPGIEGHRTSKHIILVVKRLESGGNRTQVFQCPTKTRV